jgi:hypothetical protein
MHQRFGNVLSKNKKAQALCTKTNEESIAGGGSRCVNAIAMLLAGTRGRCHLELTIIH